MSSPVMAEISEKTVDGFPINPFSSAPPSIASGIQSRPASSAPSSVFPRVKRRVFPSTRVPHEELLAREPWFNTPVGKSTLRRTRWTCLGVSSLGLFAAAAMIVTTWLAIPKHSYCLVLDEQFDGNSIDTNTWNHDIELGGFGNGEFEMTTDSSSNSFVQDGKLYIIPTFTSDTIGEEAITNGYTLNLTAQGICTSDLAKNCVAFSNTTAGNYSVIPPIQSARLTTRLSHSIKYGRVEVKAKMPTGDYIWPAIWMLPTSSVYGEWPRSGEMDLVESSGNIPASNWDDGVNVAKSALHFGLDYTTDRYTKTRGEYRTKQQYLNQQFTTFGLDWDSKGVSMWTSIRSRVSLIVNFNKSFWQRGGFSGAIVNGTTAINPWLGQGKGAPFDQEFHLLLSVAVGGTNGWFPDTPSKPWSNNSPSAARDFWLNREKTWAPTWPTDPKERALVVESVRMWRLREKGDTDATCRTA
ncbi:hypothetical protein JCM10213_006896 [Rhodosporidiobolus nylandii]